MATASFRFYAELNDFLAPSRRGHEFAYGCAENATVKHAIEALGVPHTEVELVLVNGQSVDFARRVGDGDRIAVYPMFEALDVTPLLRVRAAPLRVPRFVADVHLGGLARLLRLAGFDTLFDAGLDDGEIVALAARERRIVLTRDRDLLKRRDVTHGCYVRALKPALQVHEIFARLDLARGARPFSLCLECNLPLRPIDRALVIDRVPPGVAARQQRFVSCAACGGIFWEGSHWRSMRALLDSLLAAKDRAA